MNVDPNHNAEVHGKIAQQYTEGYFNDTTDYPFFEKFSDQLEPGARLLDIACGPGNFTKYFLERGFQVEGIDLAPEMITIARQKVPQAEFIVMDMRALEYGDETFDGLLVAYALIFIPSNETHAVLVEFNRVLKSGGKVLIVCQEGDGDHEEVEPMKPDETLYVNFFSTARLSENLHTAGFSIVSQDVTDSDDPFGMSTGLIYTVAQKL